MTVTTAEPVSTPEWWPTPPDVANVVRRLTLDASGQATGTFTADTRPTLDEVTAAIAGVAGDVANAAGGDAAALWAQDPTGSAALAARRVVALGAASQVALSEALSGGSADLAGVLEARFLAALGRLLGNATGGATGETGGAGTGTRPATVAYGYPDPVREEISLGGYAPGVPGCWDPRLVPAAYYDR